MPDGLQAPLHEIRNRLLRPPVPFAFHFHSLWHFTIRIQFDPNRPRIKIIETYLRFKYVLLTSSLNLHVAET